MGCCGVTQRNTGVDEVGPDEIELLELSGDNLGCTVGPEQRGADPQDPLLPANQGVGGASLHTCMERSSTPPWCLSTTATPRKPVNYFLVLFSFHLLILSLDHSRQDFIYEGILPLSGLSLEAISLDHDASHSPHMFEISGPMVDSKVFICASAAEQQKWMQHIEDRRHKSMAQPMSPSYCALSYLLPCDEHWKREELKKYLLQAPIWQWEGSSIQHMGQPGYISIVHIINSQRQGLQERLMVLFPQDVLLLSVDNKRLNIRYEGRLPRQSIRAVERSALPGRLEFELIGELVEPLQPDQKRCSESRSSSHHAQAAEEQEGVQEPMITADQHDINGRS
ncbi:hypothetical protein KUCAC02_012533 [Chaenocephalus aceratus]|uniref:Uncharacterized protein n=1 Tax=Chaenocephalus aceratus TaxID=36190 RepID=A0ACB9XD03_CHAAC|nr:hypothetical protein KUCAC02_012533 [Chaenocephalus aceratus]